MAQTLSITPEEIWNNATKSERYWITYYIQYFDTKYPEYDDLEKNVLNRDWGDLSEEDRNALRKAYT